MRFRLLHATSPMAQNVLSCLSLLQPTGPHAVCLMLSNVMESQMQDRCPGWWDRPQASLAQMEFYRCVLEDSPGTLYVHVLGICFSSCMSPLLPLKCNFFLFRSGEASPSGHGCP